MKTLYITLVLFFFSMSTTSYAQISVFDIVEDAKKERGDATDTEKETSSNKKNSKSEGFDLESMYKFAEFSGYTETLSQYDAETVEANCLKIIGNHVEKLVRIQQQIEAEGDCKKKKDLLGYQSLLMFSAGTKMFCPDEFNSDKVFYAEAIFEIHKDGDSIDRKIIDEALKKIRYGNLEFGNPYSFESEDYDFTTEAEEKIAKKKYHKSFIDEIVYFLSPEFMAKRGSQIADMRENLPCD